MGGGGGGGLLRFYRQHLCAKIWNFYNEIVPTFNSATPPPPPLKKTSKKHKPKQTKSQRAQLWSAEREDFKPVEKCFPRGQRRPSADFHSSASTSALNRPFEGYRSNGNDNDRQWQTATKKTKKNEPALGQTGIAAQPTIQLNITQPTPRRQQPKNASRSLCISRTRMSRHILILSPQLSDPASIWARARVKQCKVLAR